MYNLPRAKTDNSINDATTTTHRHQAYAKENKSAPKFDFVLNYINNAL